MRILMLNYEYPPLGGGASPVTAALAHALSRAGHWIDVVTMHYRGIPYREDHGQLQIYRVPCMRRKQHICTTPEMATYLLPATVWGWLLSARGRYDVIHSHFLLPTAPAGLPIAYGRNLPHCVTLHGSDVPGYNPDRFGWQHRLISPLWQRLAHSVDALAAPSQFLARQAEAHGAPDVQVLPYGWNQPPHKNQPKQHRILIATRLLRRKGVHRALDALAQLALGDWKIVVAGDGPERERLQHQAQQLGLPITFVGFVKGSVLDDLYATSAIFVFVSEQDNFPVVLLEAMSARCAIVTSRSSGMPEVVGDTALLVDPHDVKAIRIAIDRLLHDPALREQLGSQARDRAATFDWQHMLPRYEAWYTAVKNSLL